MEEVRLREIETTLAKLEERSEEAEKRMVEQIEEIQKLRKDIEDLKIGYAKVWALFAIGGWFVGAATSIFVSSWR